MYKLAVLDIDGTLVNKYDQISQKNIDTIKKVQDSGKIVTLCTGRNIYKTLPIIKKLNLQVPVVCMDGTVLYDHYKNKMLYELDMNFDEINTIIKLVADKDLFIELSDGYKYYKYAPHKRLLDYDVFNTHDFWGRLKSHFGGIRYINDFEFIHNLNRFYQIVVAGDDHVVEQVKKDIAYLNMERVEIRDYLWDNYLFINRRGIKKSHGIELLCNHFNIPVDQTIAIGDENNDIDMLKMAGLGIAMGNATKRVLEVADDVTETNHNHGVAVALEKYLL